MKYLRFAFNLLLITFAVTMLCPYIKLGNTIPDLLFVFVMIIALREKSAVNTMVMAAICGAVMDCLTGRIFGNYVSIYLVSAVIMFFVKESIFKNNVIMSLLNFFLINIVAKSLFFLMNISVLKDVGYGYSLIFIILPEAVYNLAVFFLYQLFSGKIFSRKAGDY